MIAKKRLLPILMAVMMVFAMTPMTAGTAFAETDSGTLLTGDDLNGLKVRIRPTGSFKPLSINEDGDGNQNCVHLYYQGKSSHLYLKKADEDSYNIYFYKSYHDTSYNRDDDYIFDLEDSGGYGKEGQVIHVVSGNDSAMNKRWQFIKQADGSYYIRNKKTQKYWTLEDVDKDSDKKFKNNTKLVQSSTPLKWDLEIVSYNNEQFKNKVQFDSRNFQYKGKTVSSNNWMEALPDDLKITDISIPGTHDSATCWLTDDMDSMSTQRYWIDEMLNAGVRHLDLRTSHYPHTSITLCHSSYYAINHSGEDLKLTEAMDWIYAFLDANPKETVIIQPKMDRDLENDTDQKTYDILKELAEAPDSKIWAGDHVPTLGEVRGKVLIISRLNPDKIQGSSEYEIWRDHKYVRWALDCYTWAESKDRAAGLTASGADYEVWTQDNYSHDDGAKKDFIKKTLYGNQGDGYTNGTLYHYDQAKKSGKDAWVFNYTSASYKPLKDSFDLSKEIHQWMLDRSDDYDRNSERIIRSDTFTGIMAFDFIDGLLSTFIYKTNFNRDYFTARGVTGSGEEVDHSPLILQVGNHENTKKLLSENTDRILEGQFNKSGYTSMPASNLNSGMYLTESNEVTSQDTLDSKVATFRSHAQSGNVPADLYVHLKKPMSGTDIKLIPEAPVCGTQIDADGMPAPNITVPEGSHYSVAQENGRPATKWASDCDLITGGTEYQVEVCLAPKFGYQFAEWGVGTYFIDGTSYAAFWTEDDLIEKEDGSKWLRLTLNRVKAAHDLQRVDQEEPTCTEEGTRAHYACKGCGALFLDSEGRNSVNSSSIVIPALGHIAGEPVDEVTTEATCTQDGSHDQVVSCTRCGLEISRTPIADLALGHEWIVDESTNADGWRFWTTGSTIHEQRTCSRCGEAETRTYDMEHFTHEPQTVPEQAATCTADGVKEHLQCEVCGHLFLLNEQGSLEDVSLSELIIPAAGHTPEDPVRENETQPTCTTAGGYDQVVRCETCGDVISSKYVKVDALDHQWGEPTYEAKWEEGIVTASRICAHDENHIDRVTAQVKECITQNPSCEENGSKYYYAEFEDSAFERQQSDAVEIDALGHQWDEGRVTKEPTCKQTGTSIFTCAYCGDTKTEDIPADPDAHVTYTVEDVTTNTATCAEGGILTQHEMCSICGDEIGSSNISTEPLGHAFGQPTYEWSAGNSKVTATRVCQRDGCNKTETETAETMTRVMKKSSPKTAGILKYEAKFDNDAFDIQEITATIYRPKTFKLSRVSYTYSGTKKKPAITVTDTNNKQIDSANYTVKYSENKDVGTGKAVITFKGNYTGTVTKTFKINPKGTSIAKLAKARKAVAVKWKKRSTKMSKSQITGYQILLATNSKFTKNKKTVTVKGYSKTTKKVTKLKGGKKYYVKIRTYKTVGGIKYYSPWSKVKTVTTKK